MARGGVKRSIQIYPEGNNSVRKGSFPNQSAYEKFRREQQEREGRIEGSRWSEAAAVLGRLKFRNKQRKKS